MKREGVVLCLVVIAMCAALSSAAISSSSSAESQVFRRFPEFNSTVSYPLKVIYIDYRGINWNAPQDTVTSAVDAGFNVVILAFWLASGAADMALAWSGIPESTKQATAKYAHSRGAILLVSAGGSTESPYAQYSGRVYGTNAAKWALENYLDGVDFDMENFGPPLVAGGLSPSQTIQWLVDASTSARSVLGSQGVISHAPQSPYFGKVGGGGNSWTGTSAGYTAVAIKAGSAIDFFNTQFYNQGASCYVSYTGLFEDSSGCSAFPGTALNQIAAYGVPKHKLLVGKPVESGDAGSGWVSANNLAQWVSRAKSAGWNSGVMGWVWDNPSSTGGWIKTIYP